MVKSAHDKIAAGLENALQREVFVLRGGRLISEMQSVPLTSKGKPCCTLCETPLDQPGRPWTRSCGGDCLACMAEVGDPDCVAAMPAVVPEDLVRLSAAATAGPWEIISTGPQARPDQVWHDGQNNFICEAGDLEGPSDNGKHNAALIMSAVNFVRNLISTSSANPSPATEADEHAR